METCKICKTIVAEEETCNVCKYPLKGTGQEKSSYIARQAIQKSDVIESIERLKKSRLILFTLAIFYIVAPFTPIMPTPNSFSLMTSIILGLMFGGCGLLAFKRPTIALAVPLSIVSLYYILLLFMNPLFFISGFLWKMIIIIGLGYGYFSVRKSQKILKANPYLASVLELQQEKLR